MSIAQPTPDLETILVGGRLFVIGLSATVQLQKLCGISGKSARQTTKDNAPIIQRLRR